MGWEHRRGRAYYYRSRKVGGRVVKEYLGGGEIGTLAAAHDAERRRADEADREAQQRAQLQRGARLDAITTRLDDGLALLLGQVAQLLGSLGFHKHRGQWRRQRR